MVGLGSIIAAGAVNTIFDAFAVGTPGAFISGSITGAGFFAIGVGIIGMGVDLLEGNGLDHTKNFLIRFLRKSRMDKYTNILIIFFH